MSFLLYCIATLLFLSIYFNLGSKDLWIGISAVIILSVIYKLILNQKKKPSYQVKLLFKIISHIIKRHLYFLFQLLVKRNHMITPQVVKIYMKQKDSKLRQYSHYCCQILPEVSSFKIHQTQLDLHFFSLSKDKREWREFKKNILNPLKELIDE
tara:strand:+ start:151 stop:612 length:462 start_codon:yes stop_codon:yes gene_type:complete